MVHEQRFKDVLSSTCQISVERIVLDLESEVFHIVKPPMPILALLPMLCVCENPDWSDQFNYVACIDDNVSDNILFHIMKNN